MTKIGKLIYLLLLVLFVPIITLAHTGGFTYETTSGDYFIDIGSTRQEFKTGELALFEFNLYHKLDPNNLADFNNVYVTISDANRVLTSTYVHRPEGMLTVFSYEFPHAGEYTITARFQKTSENITEVSFPVTVMGGGSVNVKIIVGAVVFGVLCFALGWWIGKRKDQVA